MHFFLFQNTEHKCNRTDQPRTSKKFTKREPKQKQARSSEVVSVQYIQVKVNDNIYWKSHKLNSEIARKNYYLKSFSQITLLKNKQQITEIILLPVRDGIINHKARQEIFTACFFQPKKLNMQISLRDKIYTGKYTKIYRRSYLAKLRYKCNSQKLIINTYWSKKHKALIKFYSRIIEKSRTKMVNVSTHNQKYQYKAKLTLT